MFPRAIPLRWAGSIRVTHPCATFHFRRSFSFDLHVLGLPLAFILSQDQTLHSIKSFTVSPLWDSSVSIDEANYLNSYTYLSCISISKNFRDQLFDLVVATSLINLPLILRCLSVFAECKSAVLFSFLQIFSRFFF